MRNVVSVVLHAVGPLALALAVAGGAALLPAPAYAQGHGGGGGGGRGGGWHGGGGGGWGWGLGAGLGVGLGVDALWGWPGYYAPYPYYGVPVAPAVTIIQQAPVVVAPPVAVAAPVQSYYYCDSPKGYYPYVPSCQSGWQMVPVTPAGAPR